MKNAFEVIFSPSWWLTAVLAGLIVNLVSGYLQRAIDSRVSRISYWWRTRSNERMLRHDEFVGKLSSDNNFFALNIIRHADEVKKMTVWMVLASMSFVASFFVTPWVSNLMLGMTMLASALGVKYIGSAEYMKDCAEKALERRERRLKRA